MYTEAYKKLERSLTDNIAEAQAKLGYSKNTMQFYYPLRTLNHFFNSEWEADEMNKALQEFIDFIAPIKEVNNDEFDILITFTDRDDPYYYCFKDEELQIVYHRFLPEDYEDFGF